MDWNGILVIKKAQKFCSCKSEPRILLTFVIKKITTLPFSFYKQRDTRDCGPTCLRMVAKHYGKSLDIEKLREAAQINKEGVSILGIAEAAEDFGFTATGIKTNYRELLNIHLPAILYWNQKHFVVLYQTTRNFVTGSLKYHIADPALGKLTLSEEQFIENWTTTKEHVMKMGVALVLEPTKKFDDLPENDKPNGKKISYRLIGKHLLEYKGRIFILVGCILLASVFQYIFPYLTQNVVDKGIRNRDLHFIQLMLIAQFVLFLTQTIVEFIRSRTLLFISTHINLFILSDFWKKLLKLPLSFFEARQTGDILQRITDHRRIEQFITGSSLQTIFSVFNLFIFSFILIRYNLAIFSVFFIGSVLYVLWIRVFLRYRRSLDQKRFDIAAKENSVSMQLVHGIHEIKLNNAEDLKRNEWQGLQSQLFKLSFKTLTIDQYQQAGAFFLNQGKNIFISYLVAVAVVSGSLTLGAMVAIQYIVGQLNGPVEQLIAFTRQAQDAKISLERLNEIHELDDEEPTGRTFVNRIGGDHSIRLKDLSFAYPGAGNKNALNHITLEFEANKTTAIVGMSGSGKTTILKLLQKFYTRYNGKIRIGNTDLLNLQPHNWRKVSGSVMQDGYIFSDTIERNIAIGDKFPDRDKVLYACTVANILEFIEGLPLGLDTNIGSAGNGISAGQKQRMLIARAVYKDPSFLFFDEATYALDAKNESVIMDNLQSFFKGRTVIVVAHRLSTVKNADKIIVLEEGMLCEEGTHDELTKKKGKYYELVKNQLELGV